MMIMIMVIKGLGSYYPIFLHLFFCLYLLRNVYVCVWLRQLVKPVIECVRHTQLQHSGRLHCVRDNRYVCILITPHLSLICGLNLQLEHNLTFTSTACVSVLKCNMYRR